MDIEMENIHKQGVAYKTEEEKFFLAAKHSTEFSIHMELYLFHHC